MSNVKRDYVNQFPETTGNLHSRTQVLAEFVAGFDYERLPEKVVLETKRLLVDTLAAGFAGAAAKCSRINLEIADLFGGAPQASVIGQKVSRPFPLAGMVNAKMANALDFDDCYMNVAHFAPQTVFGALAAGEYAQISGKRLIAAVALGYDVAARICLSFMFWRVRRGLLTTRGSRQVYAANAFAAMASAAHALRLTTQNLKNAFGNCGHFAPCLTRSIMTVAPCDEMNKYCDAGWSTHTGIMAALFGWKGYKSSHYVLDGRDGYAAVMDIDHPDNEKLTEHLGEKWHILDAAFKTYPCCKYTHAPLEAFAELADEHRLCPEDVQRINVYVRPSHAVGFSARELPEDSDMPFTHNLPLNFAKVIYHIPLNAEWHETGHLRNARIRDFMKKVFVYPAGEALVTGVEDVYACGFPKEIPATVEILTKDKTYKRDKKRAKGDPWWGETRLSDQELFAKLSRCIRGSLPPADSARLFDLVMQLEKEDNLAEIGILFKKYAPT
ncbi:MAG: MmgE/PrpD family protein [Kiritimatiellae bacterium]|nr:MmgE/PrpD family protein [Kiritimatiellia bacterium]